MPAAATSAGASRPAGDSDPRGGGGDRAMGKLATASTSTVPCESWAVVDTRDRFPAATMFAQISASRRPQKVLHPGRLDQHLAVAHLDRVRTHARPVRVDPRPAVVEPELP